MIVDRAIAAPGHGKNEVDGLNGVIKTLLRLYFSCRTQSPMDEDNESKVAVHKMAAGDDQCIDIGKECHRILSKSHTNLVEFPAAHKKLIEGRKVDENRFHYREEGTINQEMQMDAATTCTAQTTNFTDGAEIEGDFFSYCDNLIDERDDLCY